MSIAVVGFPVGDWPLPVLQVVVPIWLAALPLASIVFALLDARALQGASGPGAGAVGPWGRAGAKTISIAEDA